MKQPGGLLDYLYLFETVKDEAERERIKQQWEDDSNVIYVDFRSGHGLD
jgi:hypothetical protein